MSKNISKGEVIALILALAKSIAIKYESVGISSIVQGPGTNQITFILVNGDIHTVSLTFGANGVIFTPVGEITATNVQSAIEQVANELNKKIGYTGELPTATEALEGQIKLYTGETTAQYTQNMFYQCQEVDGSYEWVELPIGKGVDIDNTTINKNTDDELQAIGIMYQNNLVDGEAIYNATTTNWEV